MAKTLLAAYEAKYGKPPSTGYALYAVAAVQVILAALEKSEVGEAMSWLISKTATSLWRQWLAGLAALFLQSRRLVSEVGGWLNHVGHSRPRV